MHKRMKLIRKMADLSLPELSKRSGVSVSALENWERGGGMQTIMNVAAVCDALGISIDEYIGREVPAPMKLYEQELSAMIEQAERIRAACERMKGEKE